MFHINNDSNKHAWLNICCLLSITCGRESRARDNVVEYALFTIEKDSAENVVLTVN